MLLLLTFCCWSLYLFKAISVNYGYTMKFFSVFYKIDHHRINLVRHTISQSVSIKVNICVLHEEEIVTCNLAG